MDISVRKAVTSDIDVLTSMLAGLFMIEDDFKIDSSKQGAALELIINGTGAVFVAETSCGISGMVNIQKIISTAAGGYSVLLEDLYVRPEFRGAGIGRMLVDRAVQWGREQHAVRIQLASDMRNKNATAFYSGIGFEMSNMVFQYMHI